MPAKVALVTGGTRGLGRAISRRLAEDGAQVVMSYHADRAAADEAEAEVSSRAPGSFALASDVDDPAAREALFAAIDARLGRLDVLVVNAFRGGRRPLKTHEVPEAELAADLSTNLTAAFAVTKLALARMLGQGSGRIVYIGSLAMRGEMGRVAYTVAKNGLVGLAKTVAIEYAASGITANVVNPGYIDAGAFLRLPEDLRERATKTVPMRRAGRAEEVAAAVSYFTSELAAYTTGQVLGVDGGAR